MPKIISDRINLVRLKAKSFLAHVWLTELLVTREVLLQIKM